MATKDWGSVLGSVLGSALGESQDLKGAIIGGVCERLARSAVERYVSDHNFFMGTSDAIDLATSSAGVEYVEEIGGLAEMLGKGDSLADVCERVAEGVAFRLVTSATEAELTDLLETLDDLEADGYEVWAMGTGPSNLGWLPHQSEADEYGGCLCYWRRPEGGPDAWQLHLTIGDTRVWFALSKEAEVADAA